MTSRDRDLFRAIVIGGTALVGACGSRPPAATEAPVTSGSEGAPSAQPAPLDRSDAGPSAGAVQPGTAPDDGMVLIL